MKVAGGVGLLAGAGNASASEHTCDDYDGLCDSCQDTGCDAKRGACTPCLGEECEEIPDSRLEATGDFDDDQQCVTIDAGNIPPEATRAAIKAANDSHECVVHANATEEGQTFCVSGQHGISHIEFAECPRPRVTDLSANCETLTIETEDAIGDTINVDFRLLYDGTEVADPAEVSVDDDADGTEDGVYEVDLTGYTDDSYNQGLC